MSIAHFIALYNQLTFLFPYLPFICLLSAFSDADCKDMDMLYARCAQDPAARLDRASGCIDIVDDDDTFREILSVLNGRMEIKCLLKIFETLRRSEISLRKCFLFSY